MTVTLHTTYDTQDWVRAALADALHSARTSDEVRTIASVGEKGLSVLRETLFCSIDYRCGEDVWDVEGPQNESLWAMINEAVAMFPAIVPALFRKFRESARYSCNVADVLRDDSLQNVAGFVYLNALVIEDSWASRDEQGKPYPCCNEPGFPRWQLTIANCSWVSEDLLLLEAKLCAFALREDYRWD